MPKQLAVPAELADNQGWERLPRESEQSHSYFTYYRDLPREARNLKLVAAHFGKHLSTIEAMSKRWHWQARLRGWADHLAQTQAATRVLASGETVERHARHANNLLVVAGRMVAPPDKWANGKELTADEKKNWRPSAMALQAATGAMDKAIHHQRLALGLPTDITRQDIMVRQQLQEAAEVNKALIMLLQEHMCDECRPGAIRELERLAERNSGTQAFIEGQAQPTPAS